MNFPNPIDRAMLFGFLNCNKPAGMTSRDLVNVVQRRLAQARRESIERSGRGSKIKVGHAGTLDPLAAGVLVLAVGPASRLVPYVQQQPKHYRAIFRLGESTASGDLEGPLTRHPELPVPSAAAIDAASATMVGKIEQTPPAYSAVWVDGQRAYKRARAGESVKMPSRTVEIYRLDVVRYDYPEVELDIECGSGTYIRSVGIDLALASGSIAVMSRLVRRAVGRFQLPDALEVEQLSEVSIAESLLPPICGVEQLPRLKITAAASERLGNGVSIDAGEHPPCGGDRAAVLDGDRLRAIVRYRKGQWHPHRVFPV